MKNTNWFFFRFAVLSFLLLTASCDDDVPSTAHSTPLIIMKAFHYQSYGESHTIVVTDPDGKILNTAKSEHWKDTPVIPPLTGYRGDLVNVYLLTKTDDFYGIDAFLNLKRGSEFSGPVPDSNGEMVLPLTITPYNLESIDTVTYSSDIAGNTLYTNYNTGTPWKISYSGGGSLYGQVVQNGKGRYAFLDIDKQTNSAAFDISKLVEPSAKVSINLGVAVNHCEFSMTGTFDENGEGTGYNLYQAWGLSSMDIYYPPVSFNKYFTSLWYSMEDRTGSETRESSTLNFEYEILPFNGNITSSSWKNFKIETTGVYDYYVARYYGVYTGGNNRLTIHSSHLYPEFRIPDFSSVEGYPPFPISETNYLSVELYDHAGIIEDEKHFKYFTSGSFPSPRNTKTVSFGVRI